MCHINVTGYSSRQDNPGGSWEGYYKTLEHYQDYDAFTTSSAHFDNPIYKNFIPVSGDYKIEDYRSIIQSQQLIGISMGVYQYSNFVKDITTNYIYLQIPQTGFGAFFKLICE